MECTAPQATLGELDVGFISNGGHGCYWLHHRGLQTGEGGRGGVVCEYREYREYREFREFRDLVSYGARECGQTLSTA